MSNNIAEDAWPCFEGIFKDIRRELDQVYSDSQPPNTIVNEQTAPTIPDAKHVNIKKYVYNYKTDSGEGTYITSVNTVEQAKSELLKRYKNIHYISKIN